MKRKYKHLCLLITMGIMGIGMITISFSNEGNNKTREAFQSKTVPEVESISEQEILEETQTEVPTDSVKDESETVDATQLTQVTDSEIVALVTSYYQAKLECNEDKIKSLITDASAVDINVISRSMEYINGYHNFLCYSKPGINKGDYVLYVTYDMEIVSIETYAPCVDILYITTANHKPLIKFVNEKTDIEIKKLINTYYGADDVKKLEDQVKESLLRARQSDEMLNQFYENLLYQIEQKKKKTEK